MNDTLGPNPGMPTKGDAVMNDTLGPNPGMPTKGDAAMNDTLGPNPGMPKDSHACEVCGGEAVAVVRDMVQCDGPASYAADGSRLPYVVREPLGAWHYLCSLHNRESVTYRKGGRWGQLCQTG